MDSLSIPPRLPIIDFSKEDLKEGRASWDLVSKEVVQALEEYGCFEAKYDKVIPELHNKIFKILEEVFNLPAETKQRFVDTRRPFNGYIANPRVPLYETMGITGVFDSEAIQTFFDVLWQEGKTSFCKALHSHAFRVSQLEETITKMVFQSLGVGKYLESHKQKLDHAIRLMKYGAPKSDESQVGLTAHNDKNFLTILNQNHVHGLKVQLKDGTWIGATPSASTFIVLTGESFLGWSNGRLHCPKHQVMMRGHETRYSIGLFSSLKGVIQCPQELVDEQHPLLFQPFDEVSLLRLLQTQKEWNAESTLKAFYAIANIDS